MKYKILTSTNKNYRLLEYNSNYCENLECVPWKGNNFSKIKFYLKRLKKIKKNTFVILIDASDVICINNNIDEFYKKFKRFNKSIVFSAECGGYYVFKENQTENLNKFMDAFKFKSPTFISANGRRWLKKDSLLNSGLICGYSKSIIELFNEVIELNKNNSCDQSSIINTIISNPILATNIAIDTKSQLFHNFSVFKKNYKINANINDNSFEYKKKIIRPFFIQFPGLTFGNQKLIFDKMLHKLNLYEFYYV